MGGGRPRAFHRESVCSVGSCSGSDYVLRNAGNVALSDENYDLEVPHNDCRQRYKKPVDENGGRSVDMRLARALSFSASQGVSCELDFRLLAMSSD